MKGIDNYHRLLKRQIKKHLPENYHEDELIPFLNAVNEAYFGFDRDIAQIENTLEQSSRELFVANQELRNNVKSKEAEAERLRIRIESIVNSVKDVVFQTDATGRWTYLNPAWEINTGYKVKESIGLSFIDFIDPEYKEQSKETLAELVKNKQDSARYTIRYITKGDERRYMEAFVNLNLSREGEIKGFSGTLTDVTERIKAQEELKRLALVAEKTDNIVFVSDAQGRIEWVNKAFETLTEYSSEEAVGKTASELMHGENTSDTSIREMNRALANKKSFSGEIYNYSKTGKGFWLSVSVTPIKDKDNQLEGFITIELDITDKKYDEQKLEEARKTLEFALEGNGYGTWDWVVPENRVRFSRIWKSMLGYAEHEIADTFSSWEELVHEDDMENAKGDLQRYLKGELNHYRTEFRMCTKSGDYRWILAQGKAVSLQDDGSPYRIVGTHQDITERKNSEQKLSNYAHQLEKINAELDKFAYIVSHDLKAPLRGINNLSEWIEEDLGENIAPDIKKQMTLLRGRVHRMENLINGILDYSRAGRIAGKQKEVKVGELIQSIVDSLQPDPKFKFKINPDMPTLHTEEIALEQIFSNFISNALKYNNSENPIIEIDVIKGTSFHTFSVMDNGPGIEEAFKDKIFEIFQTLQARDKVESTGVGLAIVKKIIEDKNSKVWLESEPGEYTKFSFTWPVN